MKTKLFLFGLMAALALPMMAQRDATKAEMMARNDRSQMDEIIPFKSSSKTATPSFKMDRGKILWDFETDDQFDGWLIYDADGDGYNWEVDTYYSYNGGTTSLTSRSFYGSALTPDNWLVSPEVTLEGTLSLYAENYSTSWPDVFAVYVYVGGQPAEEEDFANFVKISDDIVAPDYWTEYTFDLSEYEGQTGCFAIRHYNCSDEFRILIDYISIGIDTPDPTIPEDLFVEPDKTSALVSWTDADDAMWNLRYRVYDPEAVPGFFEDFESYNGGTGSAPEGGWTSIDADGDGNNWYMWDPISSGYDPYDGIRLLGTKCITSASYLGVPLTPDNWLVTPKVDLGGELSFWACGQDPSYASEHFAVYLTTGDPNDLDSYVMISEELVATSPIQEYKFDLSEYEGLEGYIAIRHFNVSDEFRLNIDNVSIGNPAPEWIYVYGIDDLNYLLEGLTEETMYEVQVQATDGDKISDWTESFVFTTGGATAIDEIAAPVKVDNNYYNLMGQKMNPANLPAGIYIHNGMKIIVK